MFKEWCKKYEFEWSLIKFIALVIAVQATLALILEVLSNV